MKRASRGLAAITAIVALSLHAVPARAEAIVLDPGPTGLAVGRVMVDADPIALQPGARMQIVLPSGDTRTLVGPLSTTIGEITRGVRRNPDAWRRQLELLAQGQKNERVLGGTRGGTR